jgi:uncharacterized membrane protein
MQDQQKAHEPLAIGLAWFSIALGFVEIAAPRRVARLIGMSATSTSAATVQAYGVREISTGLAILAQPDNATWMWGRVAGDALDIATLVGGAGSMRSQQRRAAVAAAAVAGVTALDAYCAQQLGRAQRQQPSAARHSGSSSASAHSLDQVVTINAPLERVREFWNAPELRPQSLRGFMADSDGSANGRLTLRPAPGGRGTEVRVHLSEADAGGLLNLLAGVASRDLGSRLRDDLRKVKQIIETGEVVLSDGPSMWRAAQPRRDSRELEAVGDVA